MSVEELINRLIEKTEDDTYQWYALQSGGFRLAMDTGSITIKCYVAPNGADEFTLKLYDQDSCFATYSTAIGDSLHDVMSKLYDAINGSFERAREKKIEEVFGGLL